MNPRIGVPLVLVLLMLVLALPDQTVLPQDTSLPAGPAGAGERPPADDRNTIAQSFLWRAPGQTGSEWIRFNPPPLCRAESNDHSKIAWGTP